MTIHAAGTFDVTMIPQPPSDTSDGITLARATLDKQFHRDLEATSKGEMLSA